MVRIMAGRPIHRPTFPVSIRFQHLHQSSLLRLPRKDSQDKDSINTDATEYSKSGTDDDAARNEKAAFDPSQTAPGEEKDKAGEGNEVYFVQNLSLRLVLMILISRLILSKYRQQIQTYRSKDQSRKGVHQVLQPKVLIQRENKADMGHPTRRKRSNVDDIASEVEC